MKKKVAVVGLLFALMVLVGCPQSDSTPTLTSVIPNQIALNSPDTTVKMIGSGFKKPIVAVWNNTTALATTFVNSSQITAVVPAKMFTAANVATIRALQGGQGNQTATQPVTITIGNVVPTLTGCAPCHVIDNAASLSITLTGTGFNASSVIDWNTTAVTTTLVNGTTLTANVPTTLFATPGTAKLTVVNGGTGGGTSASLTFTIVAPLSITTTTLPSGSIGTAYSATLTATGGTTPYTWSIVSGSLPTGLTLSTAGVISGTPTAAGSSSFTIQVVDSTGSLARKVIK